MAIGYFSKNANLKFGVSFFFLTATGEGGWGFNGEAGADDKVRHSGGGNKFDPASAGDGSDLGGAGEFMCQLVKFLSLWAV